MRQDDGAAHDRWPRGGHGGLDPDRRPRRQRPPLEGSGHRDGVPELRAVPHLHVADNIGFGLRLRKVPRDEIEHRIRDAARVFGLEAARVDGTGEWTVFFRVVHPTGLPAVASLAIFQFLWVWNDLLVALVFA